MKALTKAIKFVKTKSIFEIVLIIYCAALSAAFIYGFLSVLYALIFDQGSLQNANFGYAEGYGI